MNSEITKVCDDNWLRGWVLYDGACPSCCRLARFAEKLLTRRGFDLAPLQSPWVTECLDLNEQDLLAALRVITLDGRAYAGADALLFLARHIWWACPLTALGLLPGSRPLFRGIYAFWARRRCRGNCALADQSQYSSKASIRQA